jgi:hypothetical protein
MRFGRIRPQKEGKLAARLGRIPVHHQVGQQ